MRLRKNMEAKTLLGYLFIDDHMKVQIFSGDSNYEQAF